MPGNSGFGFNFSNNLGGANGFGMGFTRPATTIPISGLLLNLDASNSTSYPGSGNIWYDLANEPTANDATLVNTPTYSTNNGGYFTFAKASSESATVSGVVVPSTAYTKAVWFNLTDLVSDNNLVSGETGGHFMYLAGTNKLYSGHSDWPLFTAYPSTTSFLAGAWYFVVLTFNTTDGMKLYVNGNLDSTYTARKTQVPGDGTTNIGRYGVGNFINGSVAQVLTYDRSIAGDEVTKIYNATKARFGL